MRLAADNLLLDLQGVLYQEGEVFPDAPETLQRLRDAGLGLRFLTNTTTRTRSAIAERMAGMGFAVDVEEVITPAVAARHVLEQAGLDRVHLAADAALAEDLQGFELVEEDPQAVILGDLQEGFTFARLNGLFAMLDGGARLIALHRNRVCIRDGAMGLDLGPFVAALEYATGREATIVGKPSRAFFAMALDALGAQAGNTVMVGDDIESDIAGAHGCGLKTVQVRTGKFRKGDEKAQVQPDCRIDGFADLPAALGL